MDIEEGVNNSQLSEKVFAIRLASDEDTEIEFQGNLLKYFITFKNAYEAYGYTKLNENPDNALEEPLWLFVIKVLQSHNKFHGSDEDESVDAEALEHAIHLDEVSKLVSAIQLIDLYRMVRALHFYDVPRMVDFLLEQVVVRLCAYTRHQLGLANPRVKQRTPGEIVRAFQNPLRRINRAYNIRLTDMEAIFRYYLNGDLSKTIFEYYTPKTESVIAAGDAHLMILTQQGLFSHGKNNQGQLGRAGNGDGIQRVDYPKNVVSVWCGPSFSLLLTAANGLYACGDNANNQLGIGERAQRRNTSLLPPQRVDIDGVLSAACGESHSVILTRYGVFACGTNAHGELGNGLTTFASTPKQMDFKEKPLAVSCGMRYSLILTEEGEVYGCGLNAGGVLGRDPKKTTRLLSPEKISMSENDTRITAISAGADHALFLDKHGRVYAIGKNDRGQLCVGSQEDRSTPREIYPSYTPIVTVVAGYETSFFIDEDGDLYACGRNDFGQTGLVGESVLARKVEHMEQVISVACSPMFTLVLTCNGVFMMGNDAQYPMRHSRFAPPLERLSIEMTEEPLCDPDTFLNFGTLKKRKFDEVEEDM